MGKQGGGTLSSPSPILRVRCIRDLLLFASTLHQILAIPKQYILRKFRYVFEYAKWMRLLRREYLCWIYFLGLRGRDGFPWQRFKNSCLRFPCFTHFALRTALLCNGNRHVESAAYALFVVSIWNAKARTMRGMHFPATRAAARKYRVGLE